MGTNFIYFIVFAVICIAIFAGILWFTIKKTESIVEKEKRDARPAKHENIAKTVEQKPEVSPPKSTVKAPSYIQQISEESLDYLKVYDLPWKPERERPAELPPSIQKVLQETESISPLVTELTNRLNDPDISPQQIGKLISTDQGLVTFILKRVNSPFYGLMQKCENIFNAIVIIGYNEIHRIVMEERLNKTGVRPSRAEWIHSNLTSHIAAYLGNTSRIKVPVGTLITLGMLHDLAKCVMDQKLPKPETEPPKDPRERLEWETKSYGIDHATLGAEFARAWRMPERMCNCIAQHHWPMFWPFREIGKATPDTINEVTFLCLADVAAKNFTQDIEGTYIGDDYYSYIRKAPMIERILTLELQPELKRIMKIGGELE